MVVEEEQIRYKIRYGHACAQLVVLDLESKSNMIGQIVKLMPVKC